MLGYKYDKGFILTWGTEDHVKLGKPVNNQDESFETDNFLYHKVELNESISVIACGHSHTLAVSDTGFVYSWGNNNSGCLGYEDPAESK